MAKLQVQPLDRAPELIPIWMRVRVRALHVGYVIEFSTASYFRSFTCDSSRDELQRMSQRLLDLFLDVSSGSLGEDDPRNAELIEDMIRLGQDCWRRVVREPADRDELAELFRKHTGASVQFQSDDCHMPWELFPIIMPKGRGAPDALLGFSHIVSRQLMVLGPARAQSEAIACEDAPTVLLLADRGMTAVAGVEVPYIQRLQIHGRIRLSELEDVDTSRRALGLQTIGSMLRGDAHIVHFAGHAARGSADRDPSLWVSVDFPLTLGNLEAEVDSDSELLPLFPFVFLNACETGDCDPIYAASFATAFVRAGARGVVATQCKIKDEWGAVCGRRLLSLLLRGQTLGEAVRNVRRHLWHSRRSLQGLGYVLYGSPNLRVMETTCSANKGGSTHE